jgi:hypothetical protein
MLISSDATPLTVTYRPVGTLRPDPRNARAHPKRQIDQIVASIRGIVPLDVEIGEAALLALSR